MRRILITAMAVLCVMAFAGPARAQKAEDAQKRIREALAADVTKAAALVNDPMAGVRFIALKKLCDANYDPAKLVPLLTKALRDPGGDPIRILAIRELAKRKVTDAGKYICETILNEEESRAVKLAAEDALATIYPDFPDELKNSLAKAVKREDNAWVPDPEATAKALAKYQEWYKQKFGG